MQTQGDLDRFKGTNSAATILFELDTELASREEIHLPMEKVLYFVCQFQMFSRSLGSGEQQISYVIE